ncbi:MAG: nucleotidyltransferase domain-containing protein [Spirochaetaceae bacterium]|nr:MAG: nucleotidyltransferase domain-containing protein [Spirochaetaceae bacterium]
MDDDTIAINDQKLRAIAARADTITRERRIARERAIAERVADARREIDRLVEQFRAADPGVRRIVLFGSLAKGSVKRLSFDIDLAVESDEYMRLLDIALDSDFKVDLVDLTFCSQYIAIAIEQHGKELYRAG